MKSTAFSFRTYRLQLLFIFLTTFFLTSCALKPIYSEYNFTKLDKKYADLEKLGNGNVLIYNGANVFHKVDNTASLNIWINGRALGQIKANEYVIINLREGNYEFKALHLDLFTMRSKHDVDITKNTKVIKIKPNLTSNKLEITNELPRNFHKFNHVQSQSID
jgi:hypothetical protein